MTRRQLLLAAGVTTAAAATWRGRPATAGGAPCSRSPAPPLAGRRPRPRASGWPATPTSTPTTPPTAAPPARAPARCCPGNVSVADQMRQAERLGLEFLPITDHRTYDQHWDPLWTSRPPAADPRRGGQRLAARHRPRRRRRGRRRRLVPRQRVLPAPAAERLGGAGAGRRLVDRPPRRRRVRRRASRTTVRTRSASTWSRSGTRQQRRHRDRLRRAALERGLALRRGRRLRLPLPRALGRGGSGDADHLGAGAGRRPSGPCWTPLPPAARPSRRARWGPS